MTKIIVAGSRSFGDYRLLVSSIDSYISEKKWTEVEIVSGGARGADRLGEVYSGERGYNLHVFSANWKLHGKAAGPIRNEEMAKYANALICFWDGVSRGSKNMIETAQKYSLDVKIINYLEEIKNQ